MALSWRQPCYHGCSSHFSQHHWWSSSHLCYLQLMGLPLRLHCFSSSPLTPLMNAWAVSLRMKFTGNPTRARCINCSTAAANSCSYLPFSWILALSCAQQVAASLWSLYWPFRARPSLCMSFWPVHCVGCW